MLLNARNNKKKTGWGIWRYFLDGKPEYLARHYWWAYLWSVSVWFFDHQPIINAILFGQYHRLCQRAVNDCMKKRPQGRFLQLTCAYGSLTPSLIRNMDDDLYLMDVADIQLALTDKKLEGPEHRRLLSARMNAERLAYCENAFSTVLIFFLLHELPPDARNRCLAETIRVLQPGGRLIIAEYAACPKKHFLWRFLPTRAVLLYLEPFLGSFWNMDLPAALMEQGRKHGKAIQLVEEFHCFFAFYRVCIFEIALPHNGLAGDR